MTVTSGRAAAAILLASSVLALSACSGSSPTVAAGTPSVTSPAPSSPESSSPESSSPGSPTPSDTASDEPLLAAAPAGYAYTTVPAEFATLQKTVTDSGMATRSEAKGVKDSAGTEVAAIVAFQYNDKLTPSLDKVPVDKVLDGSMKGAKSSLSGRVTTSSLTPGGTHVRVLGSQKLTIAIAYQHGGRLYEVFGPDKAAVAEFVTAYFGQR
jgi:hypothetical protein